MSIQVLFTDRTGPGQSSSAPFDLSNLATHVGDDPAAVSRNRVALRESCGVASVVWMEQVHGCAVRTVSRAEVDGRGGVLDLVVPGCDALVTADPHVALAVLVADCVPVLLADHTAGVIGVAHAGRRGVALGVVEATIAAMEALGARSAQLIATLGPAIGACCYEVGPEVHAEVVAVSPDTDARTRFGAPALDLRAGLAATLQGRGILDIQRSAVCTADSSEHFSYRRDGQTGRFAGIIWRSS